MGKPRFAIGGFLQGLGRLGENYLERLSDMRLQRVPAVYCSMPSSENEMCVNHRLVVLQGDIADKGEDDCSSTPLL